MNDDPFVHGNCVACDSAHRIHLRDVGTSRTHGRVPLLLCLDCETLTCISDYTESDQQLHEDVEYNVREAGAKLEHFKRLFAFLERELRWFSRLQLRAMKIADLGCNIGQFIHVCQENGVSAVGYDLNRFAISRGKTLFPSCDLRERAFGSDENDFDLVVSIDTFEHIATPRAVMRSMIGGTRPGGFVYLTVPRLDRDAWHFLRTSAESMMSFDRGSPFRDNDVHVVHFSSSGLRELGTGLGLELVRDYNGNDWPANGVLFRTPA